MIHIVTIHHETDKFIDLQDKYFQRYTSEPYKIYAGLCNANLDYYREAHRSHIDIDMPLKVKPIYEDFKKIQMDLLSQEIERNLQNK